jgi:hypothetical protein
VISKNNPAGRLYFLLEQFRNSSGSTIDVWSGILGEPPETVRQRLGSVAELVSKIDAAVSEPTSQAFATLVDRYRGEWLEAIFPLSRPFAGPSSEVRPGDVGFETLGAVAEHLGAVAPDGGLPSDEQQADISKCLQEVIEQAEEDTELPAEIRDLLLLRLKDVERALRYVDVGGAYGVQRATEALMGAAVNSSVTNKVARASKTVTKVFVTAGVIWHVFTGVAQVQPALEAWQGYAHDLGLTPGLVEKVPIHHQTPSAHEVVEATNAEKEELDPAE